jgi:UMF1 family MFS transporter
VSLVGHFGNIIGTSIMGWSEASSSIFGFTVLLAGVAGAGFGGVIDDRLGTRNALCITLIGLAVSLCLLLTVSPDRAFGFLPLIPRAAGAPQLSSEAEWIVLGLGGVAGLFLGTAGPMRRSLVARYSPPGRTGRYYGLAGLAGNATNFAGPALVLWATTATHNQRYGLLVAPVFLLLGVIALMLLPKHGYRTG